MAMQYLVSSKSTPALASDGESFEVVSWDTSSEKIPNPHNSCGLTLLPFLVESETVDRGLNTCENSFLIASGKTH